MLGGVAARRSGSLLSNKIKGGGGKKNQKGG